MKKQPPTIEEQQKIAEEIMGTEIAWENDSKGYFLCPMHEGHTTPTKDKHTVCYIDGVPTFFCYHDSCREYMAEASSKLRSKLDFRSDEELAEARLKSGEKYKLDEDARLVRLNSSKIYKEFAWDLRGPRTWNAEESWRAFLRLWKKDDILWIGDVWDTGEKSGKYHFDTPSGWDLPYHIPLGPFTTGSTYKPGSVDRTQKNVQSTPYVVIEFDSLDISPQVNKRKGAAILNYLRPSLDLRMVVDSGNKSVHGWFENNEKMTDQMKFFLRQLGADIQTMRPSQPVRLPGGKRDNGNIQSVLWIA